MRSHLRLLAAARILRQGSPPTIVDARANAVGTRYDVERRERVASFLAHFAPVTLKRRNGFHSGAGVGRCHVVALSFAPSDLAQTDGLVDGGCRQIRTVSRTRMCLYTVRPVQTGHVPG